MKNEGLTTFFKFLFKRFTYKQQYFAPWKARKARTSIDTKLPSTSLIKVKEQMDVPQGRFC